MYKAYVGTKNSSKITAVKKVLSDFEIISIETPTGVSTMPFSDEETIKGATFRAKMLPCDGFRFGLETGFIIQNDIMYIINWGVMIDPYNNIYTAGGARFELPEEIKRELLNSNQELSSVMKKVSGDENINTKQGTIGYYTNNFVTRSDVFEHIIKILYGQYLYKKGMKK